MTTKWTHKKIGLKENPGCFDTGSGAMIFHAVSAAFPGVTRKKFTSYCGRADDAEWYESDSFGDRYKFASPEAALAKEMDSRGRFGRIGYQP